jgi:hypothetical protein
VSGAGENAGDSASAEEMLGHLQAYLSGDASVAVFCDFVRQTVGQFDRLYPENDETDMSDNLVWFFAAEARGLCSRLSTHEITEDYARTVLPNWIVHLTRGASVWRDIVRAGGWPITWDDDDEPNGPDVG